MTSSGKDWTWRHKIACAALLAAGSCGVNVATADEAWLRNATLADLSPLSTQQRYEAFVNSQQPEDDHATAENTQSEQAPDDDDVLIDGSIQQRMAEFNNGRFTLPTLAAPSIAADSVESGLQPEGFRKGVAAVAQPLPESGAQRGDWQWTAAQWTAANTFSNPRYFEDRMLERHGHERFPKLQPMISGVRFFATVPALPYLMTLSHPCKCESTLGYFRPGSPVPGLKQCPPRDRRAAMVQAAAMTGAILAIP